MYIFLDESGDLGFNWAKQKTSKFFVITLLISSDLPSIKEINLSVGKTLRKINHRKKGDFVNELKGANTPLSMKKYFLSRIKNSDWRLYATIINKKTFRIPKYLGQPTYLYNYIASNLLGKIVINEPKAKATVIVNIDKCKTAKEIYEFNRDVEEVFYPKLHTENNLIINHRASHDMKLLQAVDLFCYGLFSKYEHDDLLWYDCFRDRIDVEDGL